MSNDNEENAEDIEQEHNQDDFDRRSVISNKTIKSLVSKKKDKLKLKRHLLLKRMFSSSKLK